MHKPVLNINFPEGPILTRFHPIFSSSLIVASQTGFFQRSEFQDISTGSQIFQIEVSPSTLTSMTSSKSGEITVFGDSAGVIHFWSEQEETNNLKVNNYSRAFESVHKIKQENLQIIEIDQRKPIDNLKTRNSEQFSNEKSSSSDWPKDLWIYVGENKNPVNLSDFTDQKVIDFLTYAPKPKNMKRYLGTFRFYYLYFKTFILILLAPNRPLTLFVKREENTTPKKNEQQKIVEKKFEVDPSEKVRPTKIYRKILINHSKRGIEGFNFE